MAGYTRIQRKVLDYVDDKFVGRVKSEINTEWETRINVEGTIPPTMDEYTYFRKRALEIIAEFEAKGDNGNEEESET